MSRYVGVAYQYIYQLKFIEWIDIMSMELNRQQAQLAFVESGENIVIGTLDGVGVSLEALKKIDDDSSYVVESFSSGLTAKVYHLRIRGRDWTLKRKRPESLVKNVDGQTSFLNEVQRRRDLTALKQKNPEKYSHIVETQYASLNDGILLSPWIEGSLITHFDADIFKQIFSTISELELAGLFEWDFCPGNILIDKMNQIKLFDFGYMYQFKPMTQFNSNGQDTPLFNGVERFETRFLFDYLLRNPLDLTLEQILDLYRVEKSAALAAYQFKRDKLIAGGADSPVVEWVTNSIDQWQHALESPSGLEALYRIESFRSNSLDLMDDLHGKSCSPITLKKADQVLQYIENDFDVLKQANGFFFGDENMSQAELLSKYRGLKTDAKKYQL